MAEDKKWIAGAISKEHEGDLIAMAKRMGAYHDGRIDQSWLRRMAKKSGSWGRRARLAMTMRKMPHKGE